ncbi:MAG: signal peptidase I [Desulfurococcales archaeon]|nr:signal peptidase I [Desulfurococcales archaeon]
MSARGIKIVGVIVNVLLAASAGLIGVLYGFSLVKGGFAVVDGRSMEPLLHTGDLVFMRDVDGGIDVGSVVVYRDPSGKYIIHRVIAVYEYKGIDCYVIKGDNNYMPDLGYPSVCKKPYRYGGITVYGVPEDKIVGVVISIGSNPLKIPYLGGLTLAYKGFR